MDAWSELIVSAISAVRKQTVHVHAKSPEEDRWSFGSGLVFDRYHIITHAGIIGEDDEITARALDHNEIEADLIGYDPLYYLAILKTHERMEIEPPSFLSSDRLMNGQAVLAIGNPLGEDVTATWGLISAHNRTIYRPERFPVDGLIITDASIHPGNSCGPLITLEGQVAGLNAIPWVHGLGLAVQSDVVQRVANQIIEYGVATHPWLGFSGEVRVIDRALVNLFNLPVDRGIVVSRVNEDGPGAAAGVRATDMVVRVAERPVKDLGFIRQVLSQYRLGEKVTLTVLRNGELIDLNIPVDEIPHLHDEEEPEND